MDQNLAPSRKSLFFRLASIVFFGELAHGMLLYGIVPNVANKHFPGTFLFLNVLPVTAVELAGYCLAAYVLAELLFKLPAGHWVDHRGPDLPLKVGLAASLATVPLILLPRNPYMMFLGSFAHGVGAAPIWPAVISSWTRGRSARERGEIMGQILTAWMGGLGIGLILGNLLVQFTGRAVLAATYAPLALWVATLVASVWGGTPLGAPAHSGEESVEELPRGGLPRELWIMAIGLFLQNLAFGSLILAFRQMVLDHLELTPGQFALMVALGGPPAVFLLGPMGKVADRIGRRNAVIYSMMVVAPLIAVAPFLAYLNVDPWLRLVIMIPGLLVAGVAYAVLLPAWHALALGRIPEQQRGRLLALLMSIEMVALGGGHILGPSLYEKVRFYAPFLFAGATFLTLAVVYKLGYILPNEVHEEEPGHGGGHESDAARNGVGGTRGEPGGDLNPCSGTAEQELAYSLNGRPLEPAPEDPAPRAPRSVE